MDMAAASSFGGWPVTFMPLRKGAECWGAVYGEAGTADLYLRFYPYIGA